MKKITRVDAFNRMDEIDRKVMDQELESIFNSDQRNGRKITQQFFLDADGSIVIEIYWDEITIHTLRFNNKGTLTDEDKTVVNGTAKECLKVEMDKREFICKLAKSLKDSDELEVRAFLAYLNGFLNHEEEGKFQELMLLAMARTDVEKNFNS